MVQIFRQAKEHLETMIAQITAATDNFFPSLEAHISEVEKQLRRRMGSRKGAQALLLGCQTLYAAGEALMVQIKQLNTMTRRTYRERKAEMDRLPRLGHDGQRA
jgi:hypothetical protein